MEVDGDRSEGEIWGFLDWQRGDFHTSGRNEAGITCRHHFSMFPAGIFALNGQFVRAIFGFYNVDLTAQPWLTLTMTPELGRPTRYIWRND